MPPASLPVDDGGRGADEAFSSSSSSDDDDSIESSVVSRLVSRLLDVAAADDDDVVEVDLAKSVAMCMKRWNMLAAPTDNFCSSLPNSADATFISTPADDFDDDDELPLYFLYIY